MTWERRARNSRNLSCGWPWKPIDMVFPCVYLISFTTCCVPRERAGSITILSDSGNFRSLLHSNHKSFPSTQEGTRHPAHLPVKTRFYPYLVNVYEEGKETLSRISAMIPKKYWVLLLLQDSDKKELHGDCVILSWKHQILQEVPSCDTQNLTLYLNCTVHC